MSTPAARADLLPSSSTALERALAAAMDVRTVLEHGPGRIRTVKWLDIPDDWVPWLILEYGLEELLPYIIDARQAIVEGRRWQRIRGTPRSLITALGWLGLSPEAIEEEPAGEAHWFEFQVGLHEPPAALATVDGIVGVARISAPARSRLVRIYAVWDVRPLRLDMATLDGGGYLDDWSGVRLEPEGPVLSFGRAAGAVVAWGAEIAVAAAHAVDYAGLGHSGGGLVLDQGHLDGELLEPAVISAASAWATSRAGSAELLVGRIWPAEPWTGLPWTQWGVSAIGAIETEEAP